MKQSSQPSRYRVVVHGGLGESFARAFEQLELESQAGESSLTGSFADQAQLYGLLDRLRSGPERRSRHPGHPGPKGR